MAEEFKYLGKISTNRNYIKEEIKSSLKSGNAYYHVMQNHLSSSLLSQNLKITIFRTRILPVDLCGRETWSMTLRLFENRLQRRICVPKWDKEKRNGENEKINIFMICTPAQSFAGDEIEKNEMGWACSAYEGGERRVQGLGGKRGGKTPLVRPWGRWQDNIKMNLQEIG